MKKHCIAVLLAGGQGKRMGMKIQKQYLQIKGHPLLYYSLDTFEKSQIVDEVILVVSPGQTDYVKNTILDHYGFQKVTCITEGGKERYDSVWNGLQQIKEKESYVFIHDCARPFVNEEILKRVYEEVQEHQACVVGMPSKDTVKIADEKGFVKETPERSKVWIIQTPQVFDAKLICEAYRRMMKEEDKTGVTDDGMVVEKQMGYPVKFVEGSYKNIKVTTAEDLEIAEVFLREKQ